MLRLASEANLAAHADANHLADPATAAFVPLGLEAPALDVDTIDGYHP